MKEPNAMSFHVKYKPEDFMPANEEEKQSQVIMRESVGFWQSETAVHSPAGSGCSDIFPKDTASDCCSCGNDILPLLPLPLW